MKVLTKTAIISILVTVSLLTIPIFQIGAEFVFLPIILVLFIIGTIGVITIPIVLIRQFKKGNQNRWLLMLSGCAIGFYMAYLIMIPIDNWDQRQREISGKVLAITLEEYKEKHGVYPDSLKPMYLKELNNKLPKTYQIDRFSYYLTNGEYDLDIPIPITDRWHWNKKENKWEYE